MSLLAAIAIILSAVWDIVKDFVRYLDFRVKRQRDRICIRYGVLKKVEYTIPVDMIQALKLRQTLIARLLGKYMAEIVNVGMGDDKAEQNSFLILYGSERGGVREAAGHPAGVCRYRGPAGPKAAPVRLGGLALAPLAMYEGCLAAAGALASPVAAGLCSGGVHAAVSHVAAAAGLVSSSRRPVPLVLALRYLTVPALVMSDGFVKAASGCFRAQGGGGAGMRMCST